MKIVRYKNSSDITIEFQDKYKHQVNTTYQNFKIGIKNPYDISVHGHGYLGIGKYVAKINNKLTDQYVCWKNLLERCYSDKQKDKHPAYYGITTVCDEWLNFQNFAQWYDKNLYQIGNERMHIDKDILVKDNKVYSPETCIFVPQRINMLFMTKSRTVDTDLPTGIHRSNGRYRSIYNTTDLGLYNSIDEAVYFYNREKYKHIIKIANEYKDKIPKELYNALINWNKKLAA